MYTEIFHGLYRIELSKLSSSCYLLLSNRNILIDSGTSDDFPLLKQELSKIGISYKDIDIVVNTHEHFDHIGGNLYLQDSAHIMAHRLAAVKIEYGDDEVTMCRVVKQDVVGYKVNVWLNNTDIIKTDDWFLKVIYTPGHTSGCMCLYETRKKILFSGDTVFANGTLSAILNSGSLAEYLNSLQKLKNLDISLLLPAHGKISEHAREDIEVSIIDNIKRFPDAYYLLKSIGII